MVLKTITIGTTTITLSSRGGRYIVAVNDTENDIKTTTDYRDREPAEKHYERIVKELSV